MQLLRHISSYVFVIHIDAAFRRMWANMPGNRQKLRICVSCAVQWRSNTDYILQSTHYIPMACPIVNGEWKLWDYMANLSGTWVQTQEHIENRFKWSSLCINIIKWLILTEACTLWLTFQLPNYKKRQLIQLMAWSRSGDTPLSAPMTTKVDGAKWRR